MDRPYITNAIYSVYLIIISIISFLLSYYDSNTVQVTALIPAVFGIVLLSFTKSVMKEDKVASHLIVVITLALAIFVSVMLVLNVKDGFTLSRKVTIFILVLAGSITTLGLYIARFISIKKRKASQSG